MEQLARHKRAFILIGVVLCLVLAVVTINFRENPTFIENALGYVVAPAQKLSTNIGRWVSSKFAFLANINDLERQNAELKAKVDELTAENSRLKIIELENQRLSALLEIDQKYGAYPKVGAEIIAKDAGNWYNSFIIDKGTNAGMAKDMVVLGNAGLIGVIVEAWDTSSRVVSLIDTSSSIGAKSVRTDDIGFVQGDFDLREQGYCRMERIDVHAQIMPGDEIVTSNLSTIYPPGITIGTVKEVIPDSNGLTKHAIIEPVEDFKHLNTVLVITSIKE